jgi:ribonuclease R
MHRLGDVVDVRLVEAAPVAGALRFEMLSEGNTAPRNRRREHARSNDAADRPRHPGAKTNYKSSKKVKAPKKAKPGRNARQAAKADKARAGGNPGKPKKG